VLIAARIASSIRKSAKHDSNSRRLVGAGSRTSLIWSSLLAVECRRQSGFLARGKLRTVEIIYGFRVMYGIHVHRTEQCENERKYYLEL